LETEYVDRSHPFFARQKALKLDLAQTVWLKRSPCSTKVQDSKVPAATADAELSSQTLPTKAQLFT
jgi:hypothetical protein